MFISPEVFLFLIPQIRVYPFYAKISYRAIIYALASNLNGPNVTALGRFDIPPETFMLVRTP